MSALQTAIAGLQTAETALAQAVKSYNGSIAGKANESTRNALVSENKIKSRVKLLRNQIEADGQSLILDWERDVAIVNGEAFPLLEVMNFNRSTGGGRWKPDGSYEWIPVTRKNSYLGNHNGRSGSYTQAGVPEVALHSKVRDIPIFFLSGGNLDQSLTSAVTEGRYTVSAWFHKDTAASIVVYYNSFAANVSIDYYRGTIEESYGDYRRTSASFPVTSGGVHLRRSAGLIAGGIQFESGSSATPYIPTELSPVTVGNTIPRITYDPTTGECEGMLMEEQRTNYVIWSCDARQWGPTACTMEALAPERGFFPTKIISQGGTWHRAVFLGQYQRPTATITVYYAFGTSGIARLTVRNNQAGHELNVLHQYETGAITAPTIYPNVGETLDTKYEYLGCGLYKMTVVFVPINTTDTYSFALGPGSSVVGEYVIGYAAQIEEGGFATSLIKTEGAAVVRARDRATITKNLPQLPFSLRVKAKGTDSSNTYPRIFQISDGGNSNRYTMVFKPADKSISSGIATGDGTLTVNAPFTQTTSDDGWMNYASVLGKTLQANLNGEIIETPEFSGFPEISLISLMQNSGTEYANGPIARFEIWPYATEIEGMV